MLLVTNLKAMWSGMMMMSGSVSATSLTMEITLALDALSATHEHLAEGTDVYGTWRQRVGSEIMRGAVQLAGFDSTNLPRELLPICQRKWCEPAPEIRGSRAVWVVPSLKLLPPPKNVNV